MADVIYSSVGCFTSVREPFIQDDYVRNIFKQVIPAEQARNRYAAFLKDRPLLPLLLEALAADPAAAGPVQVVDCGVYMGNFSIAVDIQAQRVGLPVEISAFEANSALIEPIKANFEIYGLSGKVVAAGIGGRHDVVEFVHSETALIGGTAFSPNAKSRATQSGMTSTHCTIIPLSDALAGEMAPGLVKIDIEGNEVEAFGSIAEDAARLNNVFCVEYAPYQGSKQVGQMRYDDFLLQHFAVFDINNWLWFPYATPIDTPARLGAVMEAHPSRAHNTDLLLIPRRMTALIERIGMFPAMTRG